MGTAARLAALALAAWALRAQPIDGATGAEWPSYGGTTAAWRYSSLDQIHTGNVARLAQAWTLETGDNHNGLQATPIVVGGVMYVSTSNNWVIALGAATGKRVWEYRFPLPQGRLGYARQNRGVAVGHGLVFMGTNDNHVVAIDQRTGREAWRVNVQDTRQCGCNITAAPLLVKDKVVVGGIGGDSAHRGYLTAFDARTGRLAWRFYVIPGPGEKGNETWAGDSWRLGGGSPWMTGSFDPALNLVYWGTGNASSDVNGGRRKGDNLYTASIVALDADTGKLRWHYQVVPHDVWDFDAAYETILADVTVKGRLRKAMLHPHKGGHVYVLDRGTGEFLGAWKYAANVDWVSGITEDGKLVGRREPAPGTAVSVCPSVTGAKSWNQAAYSPKSGALFVPVHELCNDLFARDEEPVEGRAYLGGNWKVKAPPGGKPSASITAFDAVTGEKKWSRPTPSWIMASMLATAGNLVFSGNPEGDFFALDAKTGEQLWSANTGGGHRGSAVTYQAGGRQFVATPSGWGSLVGNGHRAFFSATPAPRPGSALSVFALPGEKR